MRTCLRPSTWQIRLVIALVGVLIGTPIYDTLKGMSGLDMAVDTVRDAVRMLLVVGYWEFLGWMWDR